MMNAYGVVYEIVGPIKAPNGSRVQFLFRLAG
jgi:hypothetical protein